MFNRYTKQQNFNHGQEPKTAILLVQLGTPNEPTPSSVKEYLKEFLSDRRVVEIPAFIWQIILRGIILNTRPKKSAKKYASIWTEKGSPLRIHTENQTKKLDQKLKTLGYDYIVTSAMRYGTPNIPTVLQMLREQGVTKILLFPLYPHYSGATTATSFDAMARELATWRNLPEIRFVRNFHDNELYLDALEQNIRAYWAANGRGNKLVMSFHGVPKRNLMEGDPYHCECYKTARLLAESLDLSKDDYLVSFQSRFGAAEWLQPYTEPSVIQMARDGIGRVDVVCPGFISDCLETLEEVKMEIKDAFLNNGGKEFHYIPCLNDSDGLVLALANVVENHTQGWHQIHEPEQRSRAIALGAKQ
jgi:ferrochelatase